MQKKLWQTASNMNPVVEAFTVGNDYLFDQRLLPYDISGSLAHARMLESVGIVSESELRDLEK